MGGCSRDCVAVKAKVPYGMAMRPPQGAVAAALGRDIRLGRAGQFVARALWAAAKDMPDYRERRVGGHIDVLTTSNLAYVTDCVSLPMLVGEGRCRR
jgi:hypothetical protein